MDKRFCLGDERNCPYYRPRSNSCLWSLCPLSKESAVNGLLHFIAIAKLSQSGANSGSKSTFEEAETWAIEYLRNKSSGEQVTIYRSVGRVIYESPPIRTQRFSEPTADIG